MKYVWWTFAIMQLGGMVAALGISMFELVRAWLVINEPEAWDRLAVAVFGFFVFLVIMFTYRLTMNQLDKYIPYEHDDD